MCVCVCRRSAGRQVMRGACCLLQAPKEAPPPYTHIHTHIPSPGAGRTWDTRRRQAVSVMAEEAPRRPGMHVLRARTASKAASPASEGGGGEGATGRSVAGLSGDAKQGQGCFVRGNKHWRGMEGSSPHMPGRQAGRGPSSTLPQHSHISAHTYSPHPRHVHAVRRPRPSPPAAPPPPPPPSATRSARNPAGPTHPLASCS